MSNEIGPLNLTGNQYWENPLKHAGDVGMKRLVNDDEGIIIDIPPKVYLDEKSAIPLICLWTQDKQMAQKRSLATTTWLVLTHLETGNTQVVKLARSPDVRDDGPVSKGWINEWHVTDIKDIVHLGPSLGKYCAWLVSGSQVSNIRNFELYPNRKAEASEETRDRVSSLRKGIGDSGFTGGGYSPLVTIDVDVPNTAAQNSISISPERIVGGGLQLKVTYKIKGLEKYLIPPTKLTKDKLGRIFYAWVPLTLIGFTREYDFAYENTLLVPVVEKPKGSPESPLLEGTASILLFKDPEFLSSSVANVWATTLNIRSVVEIKD